MNTVGFRRRRKIRKRRVIFSIPIILACLLGIGGAYVIYLYNQADEIISSSREEVSREDETSILREGSVDPVEDNVSILFIGIDDSEERGNGNSRSDALVLATFNKNDNTVKLLSIPRDSYVYIPGVDYSTRINHAHAYGGPKATIETVEEFLKVPVDYYVQMNFNAFVEVVDAIEGIWFDVPFEIVEMDSNDEHGAIHLYPGYQQLNGEEALALARTRKYDNDIERGKRQQLILKEIANEVTSASSLFKLEDVLRAVGTNMTTNLKMSEIRGFLSYGLSDNVEIESINLEGTGDFVSNGAWYFLVDEESRLSISQELRRHLGLETYEESTEENAESSVPVPPSH